jgi:condensin complex subunit 1
VEITNLEQIRAIVASLEAGLRFSKCITSLMPTLIQLLASSSATDVENTILLLMRCRQFQIEGSEEALRKMLPLVSGNALKNCLLFFFLLFANISVTL